MKVIAAIKVGTGNRAVLFRGAEADQADGEVSLSRISGSCLFTLADLYKHDGHSPGWDAPYVQDPEFGEEESKAIEPSPGPRNISEMPSYIKRVLSDAVAVAGSKPKVVEVHVIDEAGGMEKKSEKFENVVQAIESAVDSNEHRGIVLVW